MNALVVLFACVAAVTCNDIQLGTNYGRIIFDQKIQASPAIWRQSQKITINATEQEVITRIEVTDERPEKDGDAKIVGGGEGQKNVTIELQSPTVFRGFDFHVVVYAMQEETPSHPIVITKDTDVNMYGKPEDKDVVESKTTEANISTTVSTNKQETLENKAGTPSAPVTTADQTRTYRNTQEQVDPIVQYVNEKTTEVPELTTLNTKSASEFTTLSSTNVPELKTDSDLKINKPISHPVLISTDEDSENKSSVHNNKDHNEQSTLKVLPTDILQVKDDSMKTEPSTISTSSAFDTTSTTQNIRGAMTHQNFESISKELGQKVIFGIRKH